MKHSDAKVEQITAQQMMFNTVYTHLMKQGGPSIRARDEGEKFITGSNSPVACVYRAPDGKMCAVGFLIPDEMYSPHMEGMGVGSLLSVEDKLAHLKPHSSLLTQMQNAHDDYVLERGTSDKRWKRYITEKFYSIARNYGLDTSVLVG